MKETERLKELYGELNANNILIGTQVFAERIWQTILRFPDGTFCRGYSVVAALDDNLSDDIRLVRGRLISIGRAWKAYRTKKSSDPVKRRAVLDLLLRYLCSYHTRGGPYLGVFNKSQYAVWPNDSEQWLLARPPRTVPAKISLVAYPEFQRDVHLVDFLNKQIGDRWVERSYLIGALLAELVDGSATGPQDFKASASKLFRSEWLKANGFIAAAKTCIAKA